jgi:hypothetical protein
MFPAVEKELSKNPFFQAWKKNSIFGQFLGVPPILAKEFSEEWVRNLKLLTGDGPLTYWFLANLADYVKNICGLEGYGRIKERLFRLDEQFFPTFSEIEFIWFMLQRVPSSSVHLEYTFQSSSGRNPELKVDHGLDSCYFEVTAVIDYNEMSTILHYFNAFSAFQLSLKTLHGLDREIVVSFSEYPNERMLQYVYETLNRQAAKNCFLFKEENDGLLISVSEGNQVVFEMPLEFLRRKIKDKVEEKTVKFDKGNYNFVVLDVTPMVTKLEKQLEIAKEYFDCSNNELVNGVVLLSRWWAFEDLEPTYKQALVCQANPQLGVQRTRDMISQLLPKPGLIPLM